MSVECRLIVLRTPDPEKLSAFYTMLGMQFEYHQHDTGPFHYAAILGTMVLEIYPLTKTQTETVKNLRLGFAIDRFEDIITHFQENNIELPFTTRQTDFGLMTVITDPDGRKVELYKK